MRFQSRPLALIPVAAAALVCLSAPAASARETRPYFDLAFGVGLGGLRVNLADESSRSPGGYVYFVEGRLLFPANQGVGLRLSYVDELSIFGGSSSSTLTAAAGYVVRAEPQRRFHPVPALFLGPIFSSFTPPHRDPESAQPCNLFCEPEPLDPTSHTALGFAAAVSLDLHGEVLFGGLDIAGHYGFPLNDRDVQVGQWGFAVSLRFGATIFPRGQRGPRARP